MQHKVLIVMITWSPTEHRLAVLKKSLDSLKTHTKIPHHLIVVDNGPQEQTQYLLTQDIHQHIKQSINIGIGAARNLGATSFHSKYIAFVDNDIEYFPAWLSQCIESLETVDGQLIATPIFSAPMKYQKYYRGEKQGYQVWDRSSPQAWVMRRSDFELVGPWATHSQPGTEYCRRLKLKGFRFLWHPTWTAKHLCKKASYNHRCKLVDGQWTKKPGYVNWMGAWTRNGKESKLCQSS